MTLLTKAHRHRSAETASTHKREAEMELLKDREKTLDCNLVSIRKELAGVTVEMASRRWSRSNVDDKFLALGKDVGSALKAETDSDQHNVTQVAGSVE